MRSRFICPAQHPRTRGSQGSIYIFCDDVDAYYKETTGKGAVTQAPPKDYEYGMRDFTMEDPDGNLLGFGQQTADSVKE